MIEDKLTNHSHALSALREGKTIAFICDHHTYKIIDGKITCLSEKVEKEYPFDGFSLEEIEAEWVIIND